MPIIFKCECGQYFTSPNAQIGYKFSCTACHNKLIVPSPHPAEDIDKDKDKEDILDVVFPEEHKNPKESVVFEKSTRCQHCGARMVNGQEVCSLCGLGSP